MTMPALPQFPLPDVPRCPACMEDLSRRSMRPNNIFRVCVTCGHIYKWQVGGRPRNLTKDEKMELRSHRHREYGIDLQNEVVREMIG